MSDEDAFKFCRSTARVAHQSGLDGIFVGHHYVLGPAQVSFHPLILLASLAAEVPGGYLGTAVFLMPLHHPVEVAESAALLDVLSGGRFILGVGEGYRDAEFRVFGVSKAQRAPRLAEGVLAVKRLWEDEKATFKGEFFNFENVSIRPKPIQRPRPPIWVGADTELTVARVPEIGDAWMVSGRHGRSFIRKALPGYQRRLDSVGRPYTGLPMFREMHVANDTARAEKQMKRAIETMYSLERQSSPEKGFGLDYETLRQERLIVGRPEDVTDQIASYKDEFSVPFMWFRVYWPGMDVELALDTIRLLGQEVLPHFRRQS